MVPDAPWLLERLIGKKLRGSRLGSTAGARESSKSYSSVLFPKPARLHGILAFDDGIRMFSSGMICRLQRKWAARSCWAKASRVRQTLWADLRCGIDEWLSSVERLVL